MVKNVHSKKCPGVHFPVKILQQKILHLFVVVFLIKGFRQRTRKSGEFSKKVEVLEKNRQILNSTYLY
jgi:hypothetical protein